jgi:surface antigen
MKRIVVVPLILALALTGCASSMGPKETGGTVIGGATGAVLGAQVGRGTGRLVGVAIGTLAGALIGQEMGKSLDRADRIEMERTAQYTLEHSRTDETKTWRNPDSGNYGSITPKKTYKTAEDRYCREYQQTVVIGGEEHQAYGTACRQPDGSWKIVK